MFSPKIVMDVIYEKYRSDSSIARKVNRAFMKAIEKEVSSTKMLNILNEFEYHMDREKKGKAPFELDFKKLSKAMKKNIERNRDRYRSNFDGYGDKGIWSNLKEHNENFEEQGHPILDEEER